MLPAERGEVSEWLVRNILGLAQSGNGALEIPRVPQDDCGDEEVQARSAVLLVRVGAVADLAEAMDEDSPRQAVACFALVEFPAGLTAQFRILQPVEGEQRTFQPPQLAQRRGADAAGAAQHAAGVTVPTRAISDEQRDQMFRDSEIQRNGHTNLDQGRAAERVFGATSSRGSAPLRHTTSHRNDAAEADHKITQKLNRLEL